MEDGTPWGACDEALVERMDENEKWTKSGLFMRLVRPRLRKGLKSHLVRQRNATEKGETFPGDNLTLRRGDQTLKLEGVVVEERRKNYIICRVWKFEHKEHL